MNLQDYSTISMDRKQEKNDTKINYFSQLTNFTFYEIIIFQKGKIMRWLAIRICRNQFEEKRILPFYTNDNFWSLARAVILLPKRKVVFPRVAVGQEISVYSIRVEKGSPLFLTACN